ncbi:ubiquitin domain-containing protein 1-like [Pyrus ussuriensis x Pyrus communis]|uniref:Ubiquitin domain-containing protein 1-like n=1 Tax=Pyrus ussuriensis x Pyrus communis TaxID=2448454 RepID=A0A5N5FA90_9ROSA|nr:ubiquitin domain-containing protein 1-like [Pyrus ussuriensis x Pyrus communis]
MKKLRFVAVVEEKDDESTMEESLRKKKHAHIMHIIPSRFGRVAPFLTLRLYKVEPPSSKRKPCSFASFSLPFAPPNSSQTMPQRRLSPFVWHGSSLSYSSSSELWTSCPATCIVLQAYIGTQEVPLTHLDLLMMLKLLLNASRICH